MIEIDNNGLILCDIQSMLFEESLNLNCSTEVFIRRFMNSDISRQLDSGQILDDTLTIDDIINCLETEYGTFNYGSVKYSIYELNWIGYIYRYFCYTYDLPSKRVYKIIKPKELRSLYNAYHTLDPVAAIQRILEAKEINFNNDCTEKYLEILRRNNGINTYYMKLWDAPFNSIKNGSKTIEMRLNDEKRSTIKVNDVIVFTNISTGDKIKTKVENLYKYTTFKELYNNHDKISIGYKEEETASFEDMYNFYSKEDIDKYGVVGIKVRVI